MLRAADHREGLQEQCGSDGGEEPRAFLDEGTHAETPLLAHREETLRILRRETEILRYRWVKAGSDRRGLPQQGRIPLCDRIRPDRDRAADHERLRGKDGGGVDRRAGLQRGGQAPEREPGDRRGRDCRQG